MNKLLPVGLFLLFLLNVSLIVPQEADSNDKPELALRATSSKESYILGELVQLTVELKNETDRDILKDASATSNYGYLHTYVAGTDRKFKETFSPGLQIEGSDLIPLVLKSGAATRTGATLLWNGKPKPVTQSDLYGKRSRVLTDYVFPDAGEYSVKVAITNESGLEIESDPIRITVTEPEGDDLSIWKRIKNNGQFAYFMQQGFQRRSHIGN